MTAPVLGKTGIYRLYNSAGQLLYVGIGSDPASRWKDHAADKPWWAAVVRKEVEWRDTRDEALTVEALAIRDEAPVYNRAKWEHEPNGHAAEAGPVAVPVRLLRTVLSDRVEAAHFRDEPTVVTKNGEPRAVLISYEWYERHRADLAGSTPALPPPPPR